MYTFLCITFIDLVILFVSQYPGELSPDSISQLTQINTGVYSNHHPYWHTMLIKVFYDFGYSIFGNVNAAVATYSVFQIITMSLIEAFANKTLKQFGTKTIVNILFCLFFAIVPYNYLYSITMWKDVLFGGILLLFVTCLVRLFKCVGNKVLNYILFTISCIGFGLLRSNGWYALALTSVVTIILLFKNYKLISVIIVLCLGLTFYMKYPLLEKLNVNQPDLIESLSIPAQQIANAITIDNDLTLEETILLNKIVEVDKISETYTEYISDPIKNLVRKTNNQEYLQKHINDYLVLYIKLGLRHPLAYLYAFINQTRGYYNSGYNYWICSTGITQNTLGVYRAENLHLLTRIIGTQYHSHFNYAFLNPLISIGMHVWLVIICLYIGIMKKNKYISLLTIPLLAIVASLLIATPVFSEFRYAYAVFTCAYFVFLATIKYAGETYNE